MLEGKITISRPYGVGQRHIEIEVEDRSSGTTFLQLRIGYEGFARAVTGEGHVPCTFKLHPRHVGLVREHKTVEVFIPAAAFSERETVARRAVLAREEDGWVGRVEDAMNHHRRVEGRVEGGVRYRVSFVRYVEGKDADE